MPLASVPRPQQAAPHGVPVVLGDFLAVWPRRGEEGEGGGVLFVGLLVLLPLARRIARSRSSGGGVCAVGFRALRGDAPPAT